MRVRNSRSYSCISIHFLVVLAGDLAPVLNSRVPVIARCPCVLYLRLGSCMHLTTFSHTDNSLLVFILKCGNGSKFNQIANFPTIFTDLVSSHFCLHKEHFPLMKSEVRHAELRILVYYGSCLTNHLLYM